MNENLHIIFIGEPEVGKSTLVYALENEWRLEGLSKEYIQTIGVDFKLKSLRLDAMRQIKCHLWDTSGSEKYRLVCLSYYKSAKICCIVINASDSRSEQIRKINLYKNDFRRYNETAEILVIANHKQGQQPTVLTDDELREVGVAPTHYIPISAHKIADRQRSLLERKLAELAEKVALPSQIIPIPVEVVAPRTSLFSFNCLRNDSSVKLNTDNDLYRSTMNAIEHLNNAQAASALDVIHLHLRDGALRDSNKPYYISFFGLSGTKHGSFKNINVTTATTPEREIQFVSNATYSENGMIWLSMTMPFSSDCSASNILTSQEIAELDAKLALSNLYTDVVINTNNLSRSTILRHPTTLQFYLRLPRIIEDAIRVASELDLSDISNKNDFSLSQ